MDITFHLLFNFSSRLISSSSTSLSLVGSYYSSRSFTTS